MESEICLRCSGTRGIHYLDQDCMQLSCTCPKFESSKCQFCHNTITKSEAYNMEKYGEPHCNLAQFPLGREQSIKEQLEDIEDMKRRKK